MVPWVGDYALELANVNGVRPPAIPTTSETAEMAAHCTAWNGPVSPSRWSCSTIMASVRQGVVVCASQRWYAAKSTRPHECVREI
jgi:hypothetical protein